MADNEINNWDRANKQNNNRGTYEDPDADQMYLKDDRETNPNKEADGYGSESARSDHSGYAPGMGGRSRNNYNDSHQGSTRQNDNLGRESQGSSGRSS
jgi:hypothetical protein